MSEQCVLCKEPIDSLAADPSRWGIDLPIQNGQGKGFQHHVGCVVDRIYGTKPSEQLEQLARNVTKRARCHGLGFVAIELLEAFAIDVAQSATADLRREHTEEMNLIVDAHVKTQAENERLRSAVQRACIGSCNCHTKTPDPDYHAESCDYKHYATALKPAQP